MQSLKSTHVDQLHQSHEKQPNKKFLKKYQYLLKSKRVAYFSAEGMIAKEIRVSEMYAQTEPSSVIKTF